MLDKILDDFMLRITIRWTGGCLLHCTQVDESGVEDQSQYRIRVYGRESNNGDSKLSSDFVCLAGVVSEYALLL